MPDNQSEPLRLVTPDLAVISGSLGMAQIRRYENADNARAFSAGNLKGLFDTVGGLTGAITAVADIGNSVRQGNGVGLLPRDQRMSTGVENFFVDVGDAASGMDVRMAAGWNIRNALDSQGRTRFKINGEYRDIGDIASVRGDRPGPENTNSAEVQHSIRIDDATALFVRNRDTGEFEILTAEDPSGRWGVLANTYIQANIGLFALTMAAGGIGGGARAATIAGRGIAGVEMLETAGGIADIMDTVVGKLVFEKQAVNTFANIFSDPSAINERAMSNALNRLLDDYTHRDGPFAPQRYVPSLRVDGSGVAFGNQDVNVWDRLGQLSGGVVDGYLRENPFTDISEGAKQEGIIVTGLRDELLENPHFRAGIGNLIQDLESGKSLTVNEQRLLSFGLNVIETTAMLPVDEPDMARIRETIDMSRESDMFESHDFMANLNQNVRQAEATIQMAEQAEFDRFVESTRYPGLGPKW